MESLCCSSFARCVSATGQLDRRVTTEEKIKIMTRSTIQEEFEFASHMGPVKQLDIEKHLDTDCRSLARIALLKGIVLHVKRVHFSKQNAPSLFLLLVELAITLFVAGIVVPSFLRYGVDGKEVLVTGSLHSISIAGIAVSYTYENLGWALLGMLTGAAAAFLIAYPLSRENCKEHLATSIQDDSACEDTVPHFLRFLRQRTVGGESDTSRYTRCHARVARGADEGVRPYTSVAG